MPWGMRADKVVVNSTKSMIGHLLGAAGGVECVVCAKSIQEGFIHQTMGNCQETDGECQFKLCYWSPC